MSNITDHIRRELELIGEDETVIEEFEKIGDLFMGVADSGGAHGVLVHCLYDLLCMKNLSPLTDNPDEWTHHEVGTLKEPRSMWQNIRRSEAFSKDGGKTYYLLSDGSSDLEVSAWYTSRSYSEMVAERAMRDVPQFGDGEVASEGDLDDVAIALPHPTEVPD